MKKYLLIIDVLRYRISNEKAYMGNYVASVFSAVFYTIAYVVFINLVFDRVGTVAGYSRNDALLLYMFVQSGFFISANLFYLSFMELIRIINTGLFDQVLLRPFSVKLWSLFLGFRPIAFLLNSVPTVVFVAALVNWSAFDVSLTQVAASIYVFLCGLVLYYTFLFILSLPAFSYGESSELLHIFWGMDTGPIPYERMPRGFKIAAFSILPSLLYASVAAGVFLGKITIPFAVFFGSLSAISAFVVQKLLWNRALRSYTSASS